MRMGSTETLETDIKLYFICASFILSLNFGGLHIMESVSKLPLVYKTKPASVAAKLYLNII